MKRNERRIEEILERSLPSLSKEQLESARERIFNRVRAKAVADREDSLEKPVTDSDFARSVGWRRFASVAAAAAALIAVTWIGVSWQNGVYARLETADGSLYRVSENATAPVRTGERIQAEEIVRSNGRGAGAILALTDGSRVEMRSESELSVERADDGVRIRLRNGDIIVNAAKQRAGRHLYVQTKDMTVSVVGTVFLIKAEEEGSRVAVIQGEVRVRQGDSDQELRPGEQLATSFAMTLPLVSEEIGWSRRAEEHLALLQRSAIPDGTVQSTNGPTAFEEVSVRTASPLSSAGGRSGRPEALAGCGGTPPQIDPKRFAATTTVYVLVAWAYGKDCHTLIANDLLSGPGWIRSDQFDIEAVIPQGAPAYSRHEFVIGGAPVLRRMIQTLLAERFKLTLHREMRERSIYALTVDNGGPKITPFKEGNCIDLDPENRPPATGQSKETYCGTVGPSPMGGGRFGLSWNGVSLGEFARLLTVVLNSRPVIDQTGLKGTFDGHLEFVPDEFTIQLPRFLTGNVDSFGPSIFSAVQEQLGLKLESTKGPVEALVIDHVERPSEN